MLIPSDYYNSAGKKVGRLDFLATANASTLPYTLQAIAALDSVITATSLCRITSAGVLSATGMGKGRDALSKERFA